MKRRELIGGAVAAPIIASIPRIALSQDSGPIETITLVAINNGSVNVTDAFKEVESRIQNLAGKKAILIIPPGTYLVGRQKINKQWCGNTDTPQLPYFQWEPVLKLTGMEKIEIRATGAILKLDVNPNDPIKKLRYGGFDRCGNALNVYPETNNKSVQVAEVGPIIQIEDSKGVWVRGIEIDGQRELLTLGGQYLDAGRQAGGSGIEINRCPGAAIYGAYIHQCALDGITVRWKGERQAEPPAGTTEAQIIAGSVKIYDTICEYNGRQGLSWVGGFGLHCRSSSFCYTGKARSGTSRFSSEPKAGLDIEPTTDSWAAVRHGVFESCEFYGNEGVAVLINKGDGGYSKFVDCTIQGSGGPALWIEKPAVSFTGCDIYGSSEYVFDRPGGAPESEGTRFDNCHFEDVTPTRYAGTPLFSRDYLYSNVRGNGAVWRKCTFVSNHVGSISSSEISKSKKFVLCTFEHRNISREDRKEQAVLQGCVIDGCTFKESSAMSAGSRSYYILTKNVSVQVNNEEAKRSSIEGQRTHWSTLSGPTNGFIDPGTYG